MLTDAVVQDTTIAGAGLDYAVDVSGCSGGVPPGGSCTVSVNFIGHAVGDRSAALVTTDNAAAGTNTIALTARVPKPKIAADPGVSPPAG